MARLFAAFEMQVEVFDPYLPADTAWPEGVRRVDDRARALAGVARYELLLMAELGFGPDLSNCVVTGATTDLAYVSPKSSHAVSRGAGLPYAARLLPLPALLLGADDTPSWDDVAAALHTTGHFLERDMLTGRLAALLAARTRLTSLIARQQDAAVR